MKKSTLGIIIAILSLLIIASIVIANRADQPPDPPQRQDISQTERSNNQNRPAPDTPSSDTRPTTDDSSSVEITNMTFSPANITVKKGTTVRWTNRDAVAHDVTPDQPSNNFRGSELLNQNQTYEWTFDAPGTYTYHCSPHPQMRGTVVVID